MDKEKTNVKRTSAPRDFVLFLSTITVLSTALILSGMVSSLDSSLTSGQGDVDCNIAQPSMEESAQATSNVQVFEVALNIPAIDMAWQPLLSEYPWETISLESLSTDEGDGIVAQPAKLVDNASIQRKKPPFHGIINQVAGRYEVDPSLIRAIIFAESGFNPKARSKKGARGLMQLMPATAKALGVQNLDDPEQNIDGGVRYFKSLLDRFDGDVKLALAAYNAGSRHVRNYEGVPPFRATQIYIKKVLKFHKKFKAEMDTISNKKMA